MQVVDADFLAAARALCDEHGALLIFDEVQTGIGRTGAWFAFQHGSVQPDVVTLAKGLGSGVPIGAVLARDLGRGFEPGDHGTTFGGSPPVAAAALAVLDAIEAEGLVANARDVGARLAAALAALPGVAEVRGAGLMLGVELAAGDAGAVAAALRERGVLVNAVTPTALRMVPPLVLTAEQADLAAAELGHVLAVRG